MKIIVLTKEDYDGCDCSYEMIVGLMEVGDSDTSESLFSEYEKWYQDRNNWDKVTDKRHKKGYYEVVRYNFVQWLEKVKNFKYFDNWEKINV